MSDHAVPTDAGIQSLHAQIDSLSSREVDLRNVLLAAGEQAARRDREGQETLRAFRSNAVVLTPEPANPLDAETGRMTSQHYQQIILHSRRVVCALTPAGAVVAVISRGDPELLQFADRVGWHFPRDERGTYAGHHPADSAEAIAHLDQVKSAGAHYLVIPSPSFWWLDHYGEFRLRLDTCCERAWTDDTCRIYRLATTEPPRGEPQRRRSQGHLWAQLLQQRLQRWVVNDQQPGGHRS